MHSLVLEDQRQIRKVTFSIFFPAELKYGRAKSVLLRGTVTAPKLIWGFLVLLKVAPALLVQVAR